MLGRMFDASDAGTRAVLLTHRTWMRRYGGNPAIVGTLIPSPIRSLDGAKVSDPPLHVIGVLPPRLRLPLLSDEDGIALLDGSPLGGPGRAFPPMVRLRPGVTAAAAQAQLGALQGPELVPGKSALRLVSLREEIARQQDPVLWLMMAAAATVLLVACVNLANLIVARGSARTRELAVRAALGASRGRLVRLLLTESVCLAGFGAALGLVAAYWGFRVLSGQLPPLLAAVVDPAFDIRALMFAIGSASLAVVAFGVLPAVRLSRSDARDGLRLWQLQVHAPRRGRNLLVALEVAICLALLVGAGLVGRSMFALLSQDLGFQSHRLVATFDLPTLVVRKGGTVRADLPARAAFIEARLADVRAVTGVRAAGAASAAPFSSLRPDAALMEGRGDQAGGVYGISSGYFRAVGTPWLAGRDFTDDESFAAAPVGVLNETAARVLCGGAAACIGRVVHAPGQVPRTVVGIVRDMRQSMQHRPMAAMYVPFDPARFVFGSIVIDSTDTPESRAGLKRALSSSPNARVEVRSLDEARDKELSPFRFNAILVGSFAVLTLALAIVGVYGVMTAVVGERTREYGIRLALGATTERVNRHVLSQACAPIGAGITGGLVLAVWGSRFVASLLYGIVPLDAPSFVAAAGIVLVSGLAAALIPARRAGRVDPMIALRTE
jgi:putative ABC transport system permease protein